MIAVLDGIHILVGVLVGADEYSLSRGGYCECFSSYYFWKNRAT